MRDGVVRLELDSPPITSLGFQQAIQTAEDNSSMMGAAAAAKLAGLRVFQVDGGTESPSMMLK